MCKKLICQICKRELSPLGMPNHLKHAHDLRVKEYYDQYLKKPDEGICYVCGGPTRFIHMTQGYSKYCCMQCVGKSDIRAEHIRQTNLEKYGCENPFGSPEIREKSKLTRLKKYGDVNYNNREKSKKTCLDKYGADNPWKAKEVQEKIKQTNLERRGVEYSFQDPSTIEKVKKTKLKRHGDEKYNNREKCKETCKEKYGVENVFQSKEIMSKVDKEECLKKAIETKKKNNTFNTSKSENLVYQELCNLFDKENIIRQFSDSRYPFSCDFYISNLDLFIECNFHWTHGFHWFNENDKEDLRILNLWKSKNSKYYQQAIYTWTNLDLRKRDMAKRNNLNYLVFWNLEEFYEWEKDK